MFSGLSCATTHQLGVEAFDADGNVSARGVQSAATLLCAAPTGLVASYSFDDGSGSARATPPATATTA